MKLKSSALQAGKFLFLVFILLQYSCNKTPSDEPGTKPNILLILTDDQGWGDLGLHGNPVLETPNIDKLGMQGVRFDRFYVSPLCAPTRASLLTGRYHLRTGTSWVTHRKEVMRSEEKTIAEYLREAGYKTGCFGKWHNGEQYPNDPLGQGFDEFLGFKGGHLNNYFDSDLCHNNEIVKTSGYITDVLTNAAINFIGENQERSFFCYVPYNAPHSPFQVPDAFFEKYKSMGLDDRDASVYGMVENLDLNIARLLSALDSFQITEKTIVIFMTDNGPNGSRYNGDMKGIKGSVDEGGIRVPFFIRWPGKIQEGILVKEAGRHIDILPTIMELCDIKYTPVNPLDGRSLIADLNRPAGQEIRTNIIYSIQNNGEENYYPSSIRTPEYLYVIDQSRQAHLYDMINDPGQKEDMVEKHIQFGDSLDSVLLKWFNEIKTNGIDPLPIPVGYPENPLTQLPSPESKISGGLQFAGKMGWANDWIINWKNSADKAVWEMDVNTQGTYEVFMEYSSGKASAGKKITVSSGSGKLEYSLSGEVIAPYIESPDRVKRAEVYERRWERVPVGETILEKGLQELSVQPAEVMDDTAFSVKAVYLELKNH
ncbi:MAG TPA: arylsulfatase [Cyclobacteriaceae bacterium]|nr:arylsulfatase [Cyclobacteriaceae bacterium]